jgi:hypothetical protein
MILKKSMLFSTITLLVLIFSKARAIPIDLDTFIPFPPSSVSISADGFTATVTENPDITPVSLINLSVFIPAEAASLSFNYSLTVAADNEDFFDFYIEDLSFPTFSTGGFEGIYAGTHDSDVSGFQGQFMPVIFDFIAGFGEWEAYESILIIENVNINPVPEPSTLMLVLPALLGFGIFARKKLFKR